jgi:hypothetical protein
VTRALVIAIALVVIAQAKRAEAYPQFQLSKDQTCSGCHISPAGGGLLNENGLNTADTLSMYGTSPAFLNGIVTLPDYLQVGGDFRYAYGYLQTPHRYLLGFPMQADLYGSAKYDAFRVYVTVGYRPGQTLAGTTSFSAPWSREHYLMWQSAPDSAEGWFVRAGRFMPVFGLRFAEHDDYTRRQGGVPLYGETYGVAGEYVTQEYEGHLTAFIADPLIDPVLHNSGAAAYGEYRLDKATAVGGEGMVTVSDDDRKLRIGATGKRYLPTPKVLLQGELQLVDQIIPHGNRDGSTTYTYSAVGYLMASWEPAQGFLVDGGLGYWNENLRIHGPYHNQFDLNVHWFATSHFEALLIARKELVELEVSNHPTGSYVMLMGHYRL